MAAITLEGWRNSGGTDHWKQVLPPRIMLDVRHEDLVADPEAQVRRFVAH